MRRQGTDAVILGRRCGERCERAPGSGSWCDELEPDGYDCEREDWGEVF